MVDDHVNKGVSVSIAMVASKFGISTSSAYTILVKKLEYKPYKPQNVVELSARHKESCVSFCHWVLQQDLTFPEYWLWSDEKWFVLKQRPNKQKQTFLGSSKSRDTSTV